MICKQQDKNIKTKYNHKLQNFKGFTLLINEGLEFWTLKDLPYRPELI
jgi:hypothetical protein